MDEVAEFHPIVEQVLRQALQDLDLDTIYEVKHHPPIPGSSITPDFGVFIRNSTNPVFLLEVKRTIRDCNSERFWQQSRDYVQAFSSYWAPQYHKYYGITNCEQLITFCERPGPTRGCVLAENPYSDVKFGAKSPVNADNALVSFTEGIRKMLSRIHSQAEPIWSDSWPVIIGDYEAYYSTLKTYFSGHGLDDINVRDVVSYELLRVLLFNYLKLHYNDIGSPLRAHFRNLPNTVTNSQGFISHLNSVFRRVRTIDFEQIFSDHPDSNVRIYPERVDDVFLNQICEFIAKINQYIQDAYKENTSVNYIVNLLKNNVYEKEELHKEGKINTDHELASLLSTLCITNHNSKIMDVGTGTGSLSEAAYDRVQHLSLNNNISKSHNEILSQFSGIETDPFLNQLATFLLVCKNLSEVDRNTRIDFINGSTFMYPRPEQYDVVLMNPPYLRNDNKVVELTSELKTEMISAINAQMGSNFVEAAGQPNLYYYFVNWAHHYLKPKGVAGYILMAKFLNSFDGVHLKKHMIPDLQAIIFYPRDYFEGFKVTTCIVILEKDTEQDEIKFLRVKNPMLLETPQAVVKTLAIADGDEVDYSLKSINRRDICAEDNWMLFFTDPLDNRSYFENEDVFVPLKDMFSKEISRGKAGNCGGSNEIYLKSTNNKLSSYISSIEADFITYGMRNNKVSGGRRNFILRHQDLVHDLAIKVPSKYDDKGVSGLSTKLTRNNGLLQYYQQGQSTYSSKWRKIVNSVYQSISKPDLIIPRADRKKHAVYYNIDEKDMVMSTNFFYYEDYRVINNQTSKKEQLKCICGYLMSSFGQIQFELECNNQEGMRKLEKDHIERFKCIDLRNLSKEQIKLIGSTFTKFDSKNLDVLGDESISARQELDSILSEILFSLQPANFSSPEELLTWTELFLDDLIRLRKT